MRVKCKYKLGHSLPDSLKDEAVFNLEIGKEYCVYAQIVYCNYAFYCLCEEGDHPRFYPAPLFEITDNRISKYWVINNVPNPIFACKEWIHVPDFFQKVCELDSLEHKMFESCKSKMDLEFNDQSEIQKT